MLPSSRESLSLACTRMVHVPIVLLSVCVRCMCKHIKAKCRDLWSCIRVYYAYVMYRFAWNGQVSRQARTVPLRALGPPNPP